MPRFSAIGGFQAGVVAVMMTYAVISLTDPVSVKASSTLPESVRDEIAAPPSKSAMDELMRQKLAAAQGALEAVTREDFERLHDASSAMIALSRKEVWEQITSPRFVQDTVDFTAAVEFMDRMATARDVEGITLGFVRVTMACAECHRHIRKPTVARLHLHPQPERLGQLALVQRGQ